MSEQQSHAIDKSTWDKGEWTSEPDHVAFEHKGVPCIIHRVDTHGGLCGYAAVEPGHPWHGYEEGSAIEADVHGGITYAGRCEGAICHVPKPGEPDDVWWLGFNCAHAGDFSPGYSKHIKSYASTKSRDSVYRTVSFVRAECERLADQIIAARTA